MNLPGQIEHHYTKQYEKSPEATTAKPVGSFKAQRLVLFFVINNTTQQTMKSLDEKSRTDNLTRFFHFSVLLPEETCFASVGSNRARTEEKN